MSKVETVHYDRAYVEKHIKKVISNEHWRIWMEEQTAGQRLYEKFGEWKKEHPKNPIAKKNYPDDEYLQIISAFKAYFDAVDAKQKQEVFSLD